MFFSNSFLAISMLTISLAGCRSIAPKNSSKPIQNEEVQAPSEVVTQNKKGNEAPAKSSDLLLWQKLDSETATGLKRLGVVRCRKEQGISSCFVQNSSGVETLIDNSASHLIRAKLDEARKEVEVEVRVLADIVCNVSQENSPPYSSKDAQCHYERVRAFNENIIEGDLAFELVSILRGDSIIGDSSTEVSGIISCRVLQRKINADCNVRKILRGGISNDASTIGKKESVSLSELMISSLNEVRHAQSQPTLTELPGELAGSVQCLIDGKNLDKAGLRESTCFIRM